MLDVFEFKDYKIFLNKKLDEIDGRGRGARAKMSRYIGCQTAYTAQVLKGESHFSLEQGEAINEFLGHTEDQGAYFLLMLQYLKAGTPKLKLRFEKQMNNFLDSRSLLKNRLEIKDNLTERDQYTYYSSWIYSAIHALISIPEFQKLETIGHYLGVDQCKVSEVIEFLLRTGLLVKNEVGEIKIGKYQIHLGVDSPLISKHHLNWRLQAIKTIDSDPATGLHYSSVISISKDDEKLIREKLIDFIAGLKPIIRSSKEEKLCSLSMDFFKI